MKAYDVEPTAADAIRDAKAGNGFTLWRFLARLVPSESQYILKLLDSSSARIRHPGDELPDKEDVERLIAVVIPLVPTTTTRKVEAAEKIIAEFFGVTHRMVKEIRNPQPGRLKGTLAGKKPQQKRANANAEKSSPSENAQAEFDRLLAQARKALEARYAADVAAAVKEQVAASKAFSIKNIQEANAMRDHYHERLKTLGQWMTKEEYKLILGCLHPDRQSEGDQARYGRAFTIIKNLEQHLEPSARIRKGRGWA